VRIVQLQPLIVLQPHGKQLQGMVAWVQVCGRAAGIVLKAGCFPTAVVRCGRPATVVGGQQPPMPAGAAASAGAYAEQSAGLSLIHFLFFNSA